MAQIVSLTALGVWVFVDPLSEAMIQRLRFDIESPWLSLRECVAYFGWPRPFLFCLLALIVVLSFLSLLLGMLHRVFGEVRTRSLRSLLMLTLLTSIWCSLAIHAPAIAWQAHRVRIYWQLDQLESITASLRSDWPNQDGELPGVGPFMAYPFGRPSTLILLNPRPIADGALFVSAIERAENGAIKCQLSGAAEGDWVEWHPASSRPESFVGGLSDPHELQASLHLGSGWFLARYKS